MKRKPHTHPCQFASKGCTNVVTCRGEYVPNYDGWPEAICDNYHMDGGHIEEPVCEPCGVSVCWVCGSNTRFEEHDADEHALEGRAVWLTP